MTKFTVQEGDVVSVPSDLLILKHAQAFYGADEIVAMRLVSEGLCSWGDLTIAPGESVVVETRGAIAPKRVLFLGTPPIHNFTYSEMFLFACRAIEKAADLQFRIRNITTTSHGTGVGLDGGEALQRLIRGYQDGITKSRNQAIEKITFLSLGDRSIRMLKTAFESMALETDADALTLSSIDIAKEIVHKPIAVSLGNGSTIKHRAFVALPFTDEIQNVYDFGIYPAVRNCGLICERVDETHFTGDVLSRIRESIEVASLVIADLTGGRPNVYLEVGYAWGKGIPVIFVAKKGEQLHFDVSTHKCIFYGKFTQFANDLEELIRGIRIPRPD